MALEMYANNAVPLRFAGIDKLAAPDESGIVHQHVQATEGVHRGPACLSATSPPAARQSSASRINSRTVFSLTPAIRAISRAPSLRSHSTVMQFSAGLCTSRIGP
jgi:hypothetical protein